jgi:hypothetical protein
MLSCQQSLNDTIFRAGEVSCSVLLPFLLLQCVFEEQMKKSENTAANTLDRPQTAEAIHSWLVRHTPDRPHPPVKRPINYVRWIATVTIVFGAGTLSVVALPYALPVIQNRNLWAAISIIAILLFTSGHMFNHIRKVPYVAANPRGGVTYFAPGFQSQYGLETQVVAALCKLVPVICLLRGSL